LLREAGRCQVWSRTRNERRFYVQPIYGLTDKPVQFGLIHDRPLAASVSIDVFNSVASGHATPAKKPQLPKSVVHIGASNESSPPKRGIYELAASYVGIRGKFVIS
jgi:hypothetical protein